MRAIIVIAVAFGCQGADKVLLTRHCVRSMYPSIRGRGDPAFDFADNYTAHRFPTLAEWGSEGLATCTPRGRALAGIFGGSLSPHLPRPISVVADNVTRCVETAEAVTGGLGSGAAFHGTVLSLDASKWGVCTPLTHDQLAEGVASQLAQVAAGEGPFAAAWAQRHELLQQLQELVGLGPAPSLDEIPNEIRHGNYCGGLQASSQALIENFILEAGAGLPAAWGALDGQHRGELWKKWMPLNILYNAINHRAFGISSHNGPVLWEILQQLLDGAAGTHVLVGHDTNVDAVATLLGLTWSCGPFADNASPPHIGLLFEREGTSRMTVRSVCTTFDDADAGRVVFGTVQKPGWDMTKPVAIADAMEVVKANLFKGSGFDCVAKAPSAIV